MQKKAFVDKSILKRQLKIVSDSTINACNVRHVCGFTGALVHAKTRANDYSL